MADLDTTPEYRAKLAAQFLASEGWAEIIHAVETRIKNEWAEADASPERREALWQKLQGFQEIKRELRIVRDRAKLAEIPEES